MPQRVREDVGVAGLAEQRHGARRPRAGMRSARSGNGRMWLPGKTVKLPLSGSVTSVSRYITFTASGRLVSVTRMLFCAWPPSVWV